MHKTESRPRPVHVLKAAFERIESAEATRAKLKRDFLEEDKKWGIKRNINRSSTCYTETDQE